jgi:hypothetical protein
VREKFLKVDKESGAITNVYDEVLYVRRNREGKHVYIAPSTETKICKQVAPKEVWVCVDWEGPRCTSWEECASQEVMEVEICVDFAVPEHGTQHSYWRPSEGMPLKP